MCRARHLPTLVLLALIGAGAELARAAPIPHSLTHEFWSPSSVRQSDTMLGSSVAIDSTWMLVGSPFDDIGGEDSGVAWVHDSTSGALVHRLDNPSPQAMSRFGWSLAVSGSRVVVGAPDDNTGASDAGIAYVYDLSSTTPTVPVLVLPNPNPAVNDGFAYAVAISGTDVVVGTPDGDAGISDAGCVYVYDLTSPTPAVPVRQMNNPDGAGQNFGHSVAMSGTKIVVGACQDGGAGDLGRAYVYDLASGTPGIPVFVLEDGTPSSNEQFGFAVAIAGDRVVVSAPRDDTWGADSGLAYAYDLSSPTPEAPMATLRDSSPALDDLFGMSVSLSGNLAAVGAHLDDDGAANSGSAYVFDLSSSTPEVAILSIDNPGPASNDEFGRAVSLAGTRLLVGANGDNTGSSSAGSAYVFEVLSGSPQIPLITINNPSPSSNEEFGSSVAMSGSIVAVGSSRDDKGAVNAGNVAVFDLNSGNPQQPVLLIDNPSPTTNDYFGGSVAVSGSKIAISAIQDDLGATNAGTVYVYNINSSVPGVPLYSIPNPSPQSQDEFGYSLAFDGETLVVGASRNNTGADDAGSVYVFDLSSPTPGVPRHVIDNPEPVVGDWFGHSVDLSGDRLLVGAPRDDVGAANAGCAYVFDLASPTPTVPVAVVANPAPALNDEFGYSVAVSGAHVVIGSRMDDNLAVDAGDVMVYDLTSNTPVVPVSTLTRPDPSEEDYFGTSVAISGTRIVVGSPGADRVADEGGAAYVYELNSATSTIPADVLETGMERVADWLGRVVSIDGTNIMLTAPQQDGNTHNRGAAYLFDPDPPSPEMLVEQPAGNGLLAGAASIHFGNAPIGSAGSKRSILVRNVGTSTLEIQQISITGGDSENFNKTVPSLPLSLAVDETMVIDVSFEPSGTGSLVTTLSIESNAGTGNPFEIMMTGQGLSAGDDTDGDGLNDVVELQMESLGFDWQVNDEELVDLLQWGGNATGLYSGQQLQEMNPSTPLLSRDPFTGAFNLTVALKKSAGLNSFTLFQMEAQQTAISPEGRLEFRFTPSGRRGFFRLEPR